jgi:hypothetical protein
MKPDPGSESEKSAPWGGSVFLDGWTGGSNPIEVSNSAAGIIVHAFPMSLRKHSLEQPCLPYPCVRIAAPAGTEDVAAHFDTPLYNSDAQSNAPEFLDASGQPITDRTTMVHGSRDLNSEFGKQFPEIGHLHATRVLLLLVVPIPLLCQGLPIGLSPANETLFKLPV